MAEKNQRKSRDEQIAAKVPLRCRWFGHDDRIIPDPRPSDYGLHGRPILRPSPVQCVRCGSVSYER